MTTEQILGLLAVAAAGIFIGGGLWPMKLMKHFEFEHWWFTSMSLALIVIPWTVTLLGCPDVFAAYATVPTKTLIAANACSMAWGVANVLSGICIMRIGIALTGAVVSGTGVTIGVIFPMAVKASGLFQDAPGITSPAGLTIIVGAAVMLGGVFLAARAGFARDRVLREKPNRRAKSFGVGLTMAILAGILSCGLSFAFIYSQGPVVEAVQAHGAGPMAASFSVWAIGLGGGAFINVLYPAILITRKRAWGVLMRHWPELLLSVIIAINMALSVVLMGRGMQMLGMLGASIGFGIQQAFQMLGSQGTGFISGEWRGIHGKPRRLMYMAIGLLLIAAMIMAAANSLAKTA